MRNKKATNIGVGAVLLGLSARWDWLRDIIGIPGMIDDLSVWGTHLNAIDAFGIALILFGGASIIYGHRDRFEFLSRFIPGLFGPKVPDRMPIIELRDLAKETGWDFESGNSLHILDFVHALAQAGVDCALKFWGRRNRSSFEDILRDERLIRIPPSHWVEYIIEGTRLLQVEDNLEVYTYSIERIASGHDDQSYADIHVERGPARRWLFRSAEKFKGRRKPTVNFRPS